MVNELRLKASTIKKSVVKVISVINDSGKQFSSTGSGFIVNNDGIVVTNSHVVLTNEPAQTKVQFHDGVQKQCIQIIHRDQNLDFIILKIEGENYVPIELGAYQNVEEGDDVYFCGYPLRSNHHTIHGGIISSKFQKGGINIIQLDGSVNSGNSGGPLLNSDDKVVGIITRKAGGIDEKLMNISKIVKSAPSVMTINYALSNGQKVDVDPTKSLADVIQIIHDYTSVGIGYAFSIEYTKTELLRRQLIR